MAVHNTRRTRRGGSSLSLSAALTEAASWFCAIFLIGLILVGSIYSLEEGEDKSTVTGGGIGDGLVFDRHRPCDEIYVVGEGETLNTISDKCGDPFIVERNPHIHDPDDVFPGLVIKITPTITT